MDQIWIRRDPCRVDHKGSSRHRIPPSAGFPLPWPCSRACLLSFHHCLQLHPHSWAHQWWPGRPPTPGSAPVGCCIGCCASGQSSCLVRVSSALPISLTEGRSINRRVTGRGATGRRDQAWDASGCVSFQGNLGRWILWPDSGTLLRINVTLLMFLLPQSYSGSLQPKALSLTMPTSCPN